MEYEDFKNLKINPVNSSKLTLIIISKFLGFSELIIFEIRLKRKDCDIYDTVRMLCEKVSQLEKENKLIKFKLENKIFKNEKEIDFIKNKIKQIPLYKDSKINLKLKFRLTDDGIKVTDFHRICNFIPNNIVLVFTSTGERFGGFTRLPWTSSNQNKKNDNAFCFSLTRKKIYRIIEGLDAIGDYSNNGPTFLNNIFCVGSSSNVLTNGNCSNKGKSNYYGEGLNYEINNYNQYFEVREFEFYEVLFQ
ncbi:hypothetical protein PIROE2DRAFT_21059 [Piromyces sp. E2]|nr:hypothetical protein PIROE2DRAFT_21059 [Piromyces sp. E2]|eukprot:OUM60603.1 hypothetical protein PIROE2DRAFT_21059 [Piromyces sp. E2]